MQTKRTQSPNQIRINALIDSQCWLINMEFNYPLNPIDYGWTFKQERMREYCENLSQALLERSGYNNRYAGLD